MLLSATKINSFKMSNRTILYNFVLGNLDLLTHLLLAS